jgi:putative ribosome biogenesis GTPase RsgA
MSNLVTKAVESIYKMNNDELNQVIEAIKLKRTHLARQASRSLMVGDTVTFDAKMRGQVTGQVVKINRKTAQVRCNRTQGLWKVTASMLTQVA